MYTARGPIAHETGATEPWHNMRGPETPKLKLTDLEGPDERIADTGLPIPDCR